MAITDLSQYVVISIVVIVERHILLTGQMIHITRVRKYDNIPVYY